MDRNGPSLETYIYRSGSIGRKFSEALRQRARRTDKAPDFVASLLSAQL